MTDNQIRRLVQERMANGTLPRDAPVIAQPVVPGQPTPILLTGGSALPQPCSVCDETATQMHYNPPDGRLAFHTRCYEIWREEAEK
jgi:hypothetical protein